MARKSPWLRCQTPQGGGRGEEGISDAGDDHHQFLTRPRPLFRLTRQAVGHQAGISWLEPSDVEELSSHLDQSRDCRHTIELHGNVAFAPAQYGARTALHELSVHEHVLEVKVARELVQRLDGRQATCGALGHQVTRRGQ